MAKLAMNRATITIANNSPWINILYVMYKMPCDAKIPVYVSSNAIGINVAAVTSGNRVTVPIMTNVMDKTGL